MSFTLQVSDDWEAVEREVLRYIRPLKPDPDLLDEIEIDVDLAAWSGGALNPHGGMFAPIKVGFWV